MKNGTPRPVRSKPTSVPRPERVQRISVSLPETVFRELDKMVAERGFGSRSQAISEMITESLIDHHEDRGDQIMTGTITLFYDGSRGNLLAQIAELQRAHIDEVISSLHVLLEHGHVMEVILVQGPAGQLKRIADELIACRGVKTGKLTLTSTLIPPIHPMQRRA